MNTTHNTMIALAAVLLLTCCQSSPTPSAADSSQLAAATPQPYSGTGYLSLDGEKGRFAPCDGNPTLDIANPSNLTTPQSDPMGKCPGEPIWAQLNGTVLNGVLTVAKTDSLAPITKFSACLGFEYVCSGTEPFWQVMIMPGNKSAYYKHLGLEHGITFDYAAPTNENGTIKFVMANRADASKTMTITIKKEVCSDGMSDMKYPYSATIQYKGETLHGCAETPGEMAKE
jgi:uncharacterized membrane protein